MFKDFNTPILFLIFNRPDTTELVFNAIKEIKPKKLYIAADGPRIYVDGEKEKCDKVRDICKVDWDCEVKTLFREDNLGCGKAVSSAIDWFFENEDEGIILEDDCLPNLSFFGFCEDLLSYYRDDKDVFMISGSNFVPMESSLCDNSYYFSRNPYIWGWATWKRAWSNYSFEIRDFDFFKKQFLNKDPGLSKRIKKYWLQNFQKILNKTIDTWDYQWTYQIIKEKGLCIVPRKNLILNIGFGSNASHTKVKALKHQNPASESISFPLVRPVNKTINKKADDFVNKKIFLNNFILKNFLRKMGILVYIKKFLKIYKKYV